MGESVTLSIICPTLLGRADQLATLHLLIEQAKRGEGHGALISGEAGMGKSCLVAEAKTYAALQGFLLLQGNCFPTDITYPYAPLLDLLRTLFASPLVATLAANLEILAREIFPLLPELVPVQTVPLPTLDHEQETQLAPLSRNDVDTMFSAIFDRRHTSFDMRCFLHGQLQQFPPTSNVPQTFPLDAHLEDLAYHFYQARVWQKALDYTQRAGE